MSGNDRTILLVIPVVAAVVVFWLLVLSPKRDEASKLDSQISQLQSSIAEQQQAAQAGLEARKQFPRDYQRLVVMGKAVPVDDETASLLVQLNRIAEHSGADFRAITLSSGGSTDSAAAAAPAAAPAEDSATAAAAPATESAAATLPIGASVGSAGLPTLPYELTFRGNYFEVADFMAGVDRLVKTRKTTIAADGRLVTIDGFSMTADDAFPYPFLKATVQVTTYVTPADQGLTAGATPTGPALASSTAPAPSP
jgi:Tfp pilus assembly protein PilO